jgi:hypothetical protein
VAKSRIFELNGKAYDALTGELLGDARHLQHEAPVQHTPFQAAPSMHRAEALHSPGRLHPDTKHAAAHQPQSSNTLMRQLVAKPGKQLTAAQPSARVHTPSHSLHVSKMSPSMIRAKTSSEVIDPVRAQRANEALRSQAVQRFQAQQLAVAPTTSSSGSGITLIHPPVASKLVNVAAPAAVTPRPAPVPPPMAAPVSSNGRYSIPPEQRHRTRPEYLRPSPEQRHQS